MELNFTPFEQHWEYASITPYKKREADGLPHGQQGYKTQL